MLDYYTKKGQDHRFCKKPNTLSESAHQPKPPTENRVVDGSTVQLDKIPYIQKIQSIALHIAWVILKKEYKKKAITLSDKF